MRAYAGRTAEQRRTERRDRLVAAALELYGTEGYQAVPIERLCATAGVSTRNFYQEFKGREELLIAVHGMITIEAVAAVGEVFANLEGASLPERIRKSVTEYIRVTAEDPRRAKVAYVEVVGVSRAVEEHRLAWREKWSKVIEAEAQRAVSTGEAVDRDYHLAAVAIMGAVNELVNHWSTRQQGVPLQTVTDELVHLILGLLSATDRK